MYFPPKRNRRGALAVEFSIAAIVLFAFLFASIELGLANMMLHTAEAAAYEGARTAMLPGATVAESETAVRDILAIAQIRVADVQFVPNDLTQETDTVRVTVTFNFADNTTLVPRLMNTGPIIRECELSRELVD